MVAAAVILFFLQTPDYDAEGAKALEERNYDAAAASFAKAIAADPRDYYAHFNLAMAYTFLHKDDEALAEYRQTLEVKPGLYEAELNGGILLLLRKNPADALPLLEDAATQKPKEYGPRFYLAEAQLQSGVADKAAENYRLAVERDPKYRDSLLSLAELFEENKQMAEALAIYREFPGNAAVQERAGQLLLQSQKFAEAVPQLEQAYQKAPTPANRKALAAAYLQVQQPDKALPLLQKAVADEPANYDLRMGYAHALRDRKLYPAAAAQFNEAAKLKPAETRTWTELGGMLYMAGDRANALAALAQARQLGDDSPGNWFLSAIMLDGAHQLKPALEAYRKFLSLSQGKSPDQEFQARQRARIIQRELDKR